MGDYFGPEQKKQSVDGKQQQKVAAGYKQPRAQQDHEQMMEKTLREIVDEYELMMSKIQAEINSTRPHLYRYKTTLFGNPGKRGDTGGIIADIVKELNYHPSRFSETDIGKKMREVCERIYELDNWNTWYIVKLDESFKQLKGLFEESVNKTMQFRKAYIYYKKAYDEFKKRARSLKEEEQEITTKQRREVGEAEESDMNTDDDEEAKQI